MSDQETRVVDPSTGAAKGAKLAAFHLIPWSIITELAEHFGRGARKYAARNWEGGYAWSLSFAALHRHLAAFWEGEEIDDDPGLYAIDGEPTNEPHTVRHIVAVVWHACVLAYFSRFGVGTDDRPRPELVMALPERRWPCRGCGAAEGMIHELGCPTRGMPQPRIAFGGVELPPVPDVGGRDVGEPYRPVETRLD